MEIHIIGLLVQTFPEQQLAVADLVSALPGTEVRARAANGKLVVVCECAGGEAALSLIAQVRRTTGVLDVSLIYQHAESASALDQEVAEEATTCP